MTASSLYPLVYPVLVPPAIDFAANQGATRELTVGGNIMLSVRVTIFNTPLIIISWAHGEYVLSDGKDRVNIQTSGMLPATSGSITSTLYINDIVLEDAGNYTATVNRDSGSNAVQFTVTIAGNLCLS